MTIAEQIDHMTVSEKMQTLELLWASLCKEERNVPSPEWHGRVLKDRQTEKAEYLDWNEAKKTL